MRLAKICALTVAAALCGTASPALSQSQADRDALGKLIGKVKPHAGNPGAECGPAVNGSASIVGRFSAAREDKSHILVNVFAAGDELDAYLRILGGDDVPPASQQLSAHDATERMAQMEADLYKYRALMKSLRVALVNADGSFTCKGLAPGRYALIVQTIVHGDGSPGDASKPFNRRAYLSEAVVPRAKPGYHYIVTASAFRSLH